MFFNATWAVVLYMYNLGHFNFFYYYISFLTARVAASPFVRRENNNWCVYTQH